AATATAQPAPHTLLWAVGDAQSPDVTVQNQVADLIGSEPPARLLMLGDLTDGGTAAEYTNLYGPSYGRFSPITSPTIGNHDWDRRAQGYDAYWGPGVQQPGGGHWYSFDLGGWHLISLSSMEDKQPGSAQLTWLQQDLAARSGSCTLAFTHYPRYSAGPQFNTISLEPLWAALKSHAVLFLSGHAHNYQRLLPVRGITQFVVGTGGGTLGNTDDYDPRLAAKNDRVRGALRIELGVGGARLRFVDVNGTTLDESDVRCRPSTPTPASVRTARPLPAKRYPLLKQLYGRVDNAERIRLTLLRRVGSRCFAFDGGRFLVRSCTTRLSFPLDDEVTPPAFPGTGTSRWRWRVPGGASLPSGRYRLDVRVRAIDDSVAVRSTRFVVGRR
ncbi:MAG TPA: metallophosphoesterase, partial [Thermoleophilaceae bacterium]